MFQFCLLVGRKVSYRDHYIPFSYMRFYRVVTLELLLFVLNVPHRVSPRHQKRYTGIEDGWEPKYSSRRLS